MQLRPYQNNALTAIDDSLSRVNRSLVAMPTGTGKTVVFATHIDRLRDQGTVTDRNPALILAHREELLHQAKDKLHQIDPWMRVGIEQAGNRCQGGEEVIVGSVQTLGREGTNRLASIRPSLIIVDEAHHSSATTYQNALKQFGGFDGAKVLGFTATPKRLDRKALHSMDGATYEEVAFTYTIRQAIQDGYLCQIRGYRVQTDVDLDTVRTTAGDWNDADLSKAIDVERRTAAAINRWKEVAGDRKTIAFCVDVAHAHHAASLWANHCERAEVVHGKLGKEERQNVMAAFLAGRIQVLCNVDIATEGFDCPDTGCIVMLRPTQSWARYVQCVGRGTRICEGKEDVIVIDVVDNCRKHSLATVPAILDLPPGLNLKGKTLEEAAKNLEKLGGAGGALLIRVNPKDIDEIDSLLERVDLLANIDTPADVQSLTRNAWLAQPNGGLFLSCGTLESGPIEARLSMDAIGVWHGQMTGFDDFKCGADMAAALRIVDQRIKEQWPDANALIHRNSSWRRVPEPPTDKQVNMLRRLGYRPDALPNLTKGLASNLISQGLSRR